MVRCLKCGNENPPDVEFCILCGTKLEEELYKDLHRKIAKIITEAENNMYFKKSKDLEYRVTFDIPVYLPKEGEEPETFWYFKTKNKALRFMKKNCYKFPGITSYLEINGSYGWTLIEYFRIKKPAPVIKEKRIIYKERAIMEKTVTTLKAEPIIWGKKIRGLLGPNIKSYPKSYPREEDTHDPREWGKRGYIIASNYWNTRGFKYYESGECIKAIECYDNALEINPNHVLAWVNRGLALITLKELYDAMDDAIECYNNALKLYPNCAQAWFNIGMILDDLKQHQEAIKCYERALMIDPNYQEAKKAKAYTEKLLNKM